MDNLEKINEEIKKEVYNNSTQIYKIVNKLMETIFEEFYNIPIIVRMICKSIS